MHVSKRVRLILIVLGAVLLCAATLLVGRSVYRTVNISLSMLGDSEITLSYGETYNDQGAEATFTRTLLHQEPQQLEVEVIGTPDTQKVGDYYVKYKATCGSFYSTCYRLVHVVDQEAPVIELVADPEKYTLPNAEYEEEGFTALDNHDGDLTHLVSRHVEHDYITYTVTDFSGNSTSVRREIRYDDPIPPVLTIGGNKSLTLFMGQEYHEPGYTASDNVDGDITARVQVSGQVDTFSPGQYTLTYTVTDNYNNTVTDTRTVRIMPFSSDLVFSEEYKPNGKVIYLTFDDGPGAHTPQLLDILKKYNVKATFFVVNTYYIDTIKRAAEEGHTIAVHSVTHDFKSIYASEEAYFQDLEQMQGIIENLTGHRPMMLRFPGGSSNTISRFNEGIMTRLVQTLKDKGYRYFDWNVDSNDAGGAKTANTVFNNVVKGIGKRENSIVLQHDIKGFSVEAVERIILWGLINGYRFEALTMDSPVCEHRINN